MKKNFACRIVRNVCLATILLAHASLVFAQTCSKPSPPATADVRPPTIDWVWNNRIKVDDNGNPMAFTFKNFAFDQIMVNKGYLNYLVRWESDEKVSATQRDQIALMIEKQLNLWIETWLKGYDCWPYDHVKVNVVAWAVKDRATLLWQDSEWTGKVYTGIYESFDTQKKEPTGPQDCNRFYHKDGKYPNCKDTHFDMSLWCTKGFAGGAGGDWGQRVSSSYILQNVSAASLHILLHEMGHSFSLPDFYETPQFPPASTGGLPKAIMQAGASTTITPWDGWMLRRVWSELRQRTDRGWPPLVVTSLESQTETEQTLGYPNPFQEVFTVKTSKEVHYEVYDLSGNQVEKGTGLQQFSLGKDLLSGVYLLKLYLGNETSLVKIVKQ